MKPTKVRQILIFCLSLFVVVSVALILLSIRLLSGESVSLSTLKAKADAPTTQYGNLIKTKQKLNKLGTTKDVINNALPSDVNQSMIISEVNKLASKSGVTISGINFNTEGLMTNAQKKAKKSAIPGVSTSTISVTASNTSYDQALKFLKSIERNRWLMQISNVNILPNTKDSSVINSLTVDINVYSSSVNVGKKGK